jgi:hypothetical protein
MSPAFDPKELDLPTTSAAARARADASRAEAEQLDRLGMSNRMRFITKDDDGVVETVVQRPFGQGGLDDDENAEDGQISEDGAVDNQRIVWDDDGEIVEDEGRKGQESYTRSDGAREVGLDDDTSTHLSSRTGSPDGKRVKRKR